MAVLVRCSSFLALPSAAGNHRRSPPSDQLSDNHYLSGKLSSVSPKVEKLIASIKDGRNGLVEVFQNSPPSSICQGNTQERSVMAVALFASNALMPLKAMAETCEAESPMSNMPVVLAVALVGATVGGLLARQRRGELARLNEQLRQINAALRRQAKIESYAPSLSYAPSAGRISENEVIVDPSKQDLIAHLRAGKTFLRNQEPEKAFLEFQTALELARALKDPTKEKKAARGLGASLQRQGKYRESIKYHSMVLDISKREGEDSGNTEAYGAIADCYTELGDLEKAGNFYDQYIARLEKD